VQAVAIGELAWGIENMLNRVIDGTVTANAQFVAVIEAACALVPSLRHAFAEGRQGDLDAIGTLIEHADLLSSGGEIDLAAVPGAVAESEAVSAEPETVDQPAEPKMADQPVASEMDEEIEEVIAAAPPADDAEAELDLDELEELSDSTARERLMEQPGIGPWTADIYLLMALGRPDIWPVGDIALATAAWRLKSLSSRPPAEELERLGAAWAPWRSVAARILWHYYLSDPAARARATRSAESASR